jgi:hypothetical protein
LNTITTAGALPWPRCPPLELCLARDYLGRPGIIRAELTDPGLRPQPQALLLSGDIADMPSPAAYEQAYELLAPLGLALHATPGNHDDRDGPLGLAVHALVDGRLVSHVQPLARLAEA